MPWGMVMSVIWSLLFGWLMLSSFVLMLPSFSTALCSTGWSVFFMGDGHTDEPQREGRPVRGDFRLPFSAAWPP